MNAATTEKAYIAFLEEQLKTMETEHAEQADSAEVSASDAERAIAFHRKDAARSRRMLISATLGAAIGWAFAFFLLASRGFLARVILIVALITPTFAQEIRRGGPFTVQPRQMLELTVPIPVKNDFVRQVKAYLVTLRYFDGTARFETQHKLAFAPKCDPTGAVEDTWVRFEVPLGFRDEKVTIQRLTVDSTETLP